MIVVKWLFLILPVFTTATASAETTPSPSPEKPIIQHLDGKQALAKMAVAMQTLNYQGTVAFLRDSKLEPMKYFHAASQGREQEHLLSLNSPLREMVRDKNTGKVSCLYAATGQLVVDHRPFEHSFLLEMPADLAQLDAVYDIQLLDEENIALLPAYVVSIKPKDSLRYARKVWLSKQWFLPLKVAVYDQADKVLEELVFTELEVKDRLPFVEMAGQKPTPSEQKNTSRPTTFAMTALPQGFKEVFFTREPMHNAEDLVDHLLLSDGLAAVSVYMEHKNDAYPFGAITTKNVQAIDAVNFFTHTVGDYQLTVMGEVPSETIRLIADAISLPGPASK